MSRLFELFELRRPAAAAHGRRVAALVELVASELGLEAAAIAQAARFHDIGKLAVPGWILSKPGPLDDTELGVVRGHAEIGSLLLRIAGAPHEVEALARHHHERLDGSGYPDGLSSAEIGLELRILAVCDVYDALVSDRSYSPGWPRKLALRYLRARPTLFDPVCVAALERATRKRSPRTPRPRERDVFASRRHKKHVGSVDGARCVRALHDVPGSPGR